jgi:drug/metabolite transporter (DMT)-like permease
MIFLFLSIVVNALLIIAFKIFPRYGINSFQAITANYYTASILGFLLSGLNPLSHDSGREIWLMPVIVLGFMFISLFYLISLTTEKIGISVASVSNKMSVVIPVSIAVFLYDEKLSLVQIAGIVLAIVAVVFVSLRNGQENGAKVGGWLKVGLPAILFVGCGGIGCLDQLLTI